MSAPLMQDYFVGFCSAALGSVLLIGAALNAPWLMERRRAQLFVESMGRPAARWTLGGIGLALIVLGGVIASGWRVDWGS